MLILVAASTWEGMAPRRLAELVWGGIASVATFALTLYLMRRERRQRRDMGLQGDSSAPARLLAGYTLGMIVAAASVAARRAKTSWHRASTTIVRRLSATPHGAPPVSRGGSILATACRSRSARAAIHAMMARDSKVAEYRCTCTSPCGQPTCGLVVTRASTRRSQCCGDADASARRCQCRAFFSRRMVTLRAIEVCVHCP